MTLRKITIDNNVREVNEERQLHSQQAPVIKPNTRKKNVSNNKHSPKSKKFIRNKTQEGFKIVI